VGEGSLTKMAPLPRNKVSLIFSCAIVAGLSIPVPWFGMRRISVMRWINPPSWRYIWTFTLICLVSYLIAGLIVVGIRFMRRASYCWLFVAIVGSLVLAVVYKFKLYSGADGISSEMFTARVSDALESALWLSIFTLPISAAVYYVARAAGRRLQPENPYWN